MTDIFGWDIGGAHLKLAHLRGGQLIAVRQIACPLWEGVDRLRQALHAVIGRDDPSALHGITMTGELVDSFSDRAAGVSAILDILAEFIPTGSLHIYATSGGFIDPAEARVAIDKVASANWHATAYFLAHNVADGALVDIGSTTTDIVPFRDGNVVARGIDDATRLATGELVYTGVVRTPLCAVAHRVAFDGTLTGIMAEWFATTADIYRITGQLPDDADLHRTADGRGKSVPESRARLARMIGRDAVTAPDKAWTQLAETFIHHQIHRIEESCRQVLSAVDLRADAPIVGAGIGRFLSAEIARRLGRPYRDLGSLVAAPDGVAQSAAAHAPAVAVALLLRDRVRP